MPENLSRRSFLRTATAGVAGLATLDPSAGEALGESVAPIHSAAFSTAPSKRGVRLSANNGLELELVISETHLLGIGNVSLHGKVLRSEAENIWPEIATPYGEEVAYLEFLGTSENDGALVVSTRPYYRIGHRMEWTEQAPHALVNMGPWSKPPQAGEDARLEWIIRPVEESHDGVTYAGFSYGFRYFDPKHPIYQIEDKATWELGGNAVGNGFIMRGANAPCIRFVEETPMYSGWDFAQSPNPHIFQHKPLYTQMQGFTFQYDAEHVLLTVHERPSHVRSVYLRLPGDPRIVHINQMCFDFATRHATPPRKILLGKRSSSDPTALANHYLRVRDELQQNHRVHYGLKYDKARPVSHLEANGLAEFDKFPAAFRQLEQWGIRRAFIMPIWRSPDTDINPLFANQEDRFGVFGNLCCPLELEIAESYGGWQGFERLMKSAAAAGVEPYIWHASHFSSLTPLLATIPDLFCRDQSGQYNRNNYGHVLMAVNQRSPRYQSYILDCYRKASGLGLKGIFHDSHFNLATDTINYLHGDYGSEEHAAHPDAFAYPGDARGTDQIWSMHDVSLGLQSRLQDEFGLFYNVESEGALGTSQTSPDYEFLRGNEYIYSNMDSAIDVHDLKHHGDDATMVYFRGLSTRLTYQVAIDPNRFPDPSSIASWWDPASMAPLNFAFGRVEHAMDEMWLLPEDRGVLWKSTGGDVLFSYKNFNHPLDQDSEVLDAVVDKRYRVSQSLAAKALGIYLISRG
jgi:hypothetical protein